MKAGDADDFIFLRHRHSNVCERSFASQHFHAVYGEFEAQVSIDTGEIILGSLPNAAKRLVGEWAQTNRDALNRNRSIARNGQPLEKIDGLDVEQGR